MRYQSDKLTNKKIKLIIHNHFYYYIRFLEQKKLT